jgi:hypothetical protein
MAVVYSNNASTALSSGITNSATSITVSSVADFPALTGSDYYYATLANVTNTKIEIVKVTAAAGTTLTVVRGQDNTTAVSFDASDNLQLRVTAATLEAATRTDVAITSGSVSTSTITDATASAKGLATAAQITKLDGIEASADVTDTTNVTAAGALMDSELAGIAAVKATTGTFLTADQTKLDGIATSANNYTHPTGAGYNHIPTGGTVGQILKNTASGTATWQADNNTTYSVGNGGLSEINFTSADNTKLDGIATSANNYVHPTTAGNKHIPTLGAAGQFLKYSASGTAVWAADNNTTYTAGANLSLTGTTFANTAPNIVQTTVSGSSGSCTGNAATATALATARSITLTGDVTGTATYNGTATTTITATVANNSHTHTPANAALGNLSLNGNALAGSFTATGNITAYSDLRLKTEIETIDSALEKVLDIRGVTFTMNDERGTGVIAQELEQVLPEAVFDNEDGMKSVAYGNIVGLLIEAIKELSAKVEELENK